MDQWKPSEGFFQGAVPADLSGDGFHRLSSDHCAASNRSQASFPGSSQRVEHEVKDSVAARKVQKADREKLRRDRLNEQFLELGKALDPDRPKNDKATILIDTIQMLKDLTSQVDRLKGEYTALSEESRELTQEKNELREEKATIKSDIDNLNAQYQQRVRCMYPWGTMDPSVVMGPPPPYPFPMPVSIPSGPIPIHPSLQPYPFFRSQSTNPCPAYVPYASPPFNHQVEHPITQRIPPHQSSNRSQTASRQSKSSDHQEQRSEDYSDVATELELKIPGSAAAPSHLKATQDQGLNSEEGTKGKRRGPPERTTGDYASERSNTSSRCSSSSGFPDTSSTSAGDGSIADN